MISGPGVVLTLLVELTASPGRITPIQQLHESLASCEAAKAAVAILLKSEVTVKVARCDRELVVGPSLARPKENSRVD